MLLGHFGPFGPSWGTYGVELFFVLSGRLMAQILFEKQVPLPQFFWRRFSRIYPALLFFVLSLAMMTGAAQLAGFNEGVDATSALAGLTFTINYYGALGGPIEGPLDHLWSIAVEEHCYALLAGLAVLSARRSRYVVPVCLGAAAIAMAGGAWLYAAGAGHVHEIYWRTDVRLAPVFLSAGLYLLVRRLPAPPAWLPLVIGLASIPAFHFLEPLPLKMIAPAVLLAYAVNTVDWASERVRDFLSGAVLTRAGLVSYSLYLWQQPFYKATDGAAWALIPAVAFAWASFTFVEKPARKWLNGLSMRPAREPA